MAAYRYVGGNWAAISGTRYEFTSYGQLVDLPDDIARACIDGRLSIIPVAEFDALGHSADELKKYSRFATHANANQEFTTKKLEAWRLAQSHHPQRAEVEKAVPVVKEESE